MKKDHEILTMEMLNFKNQMSKINYNSIEKDTNNEQKYNNVL